MDKYFQRQSSRVLTNKTYLIYIYMLIVLFIYYGNCSKQCSDSRIVYGIFQHDSGCPSFVLKSNEFYHRFSASNIKEIPLMHHGFFIMKGHIFLEEGEDSLNGRLLLGMLATSITNPAGVMCDLSKKDIFKNITLSNRLKAFQGLFVGRRGHADTVIITVGNQ